MSGFSADWLALREGADAKARSWELVATLPREYPAVLDLGAGTGANLRWLAPQLGFGQRWKLIDHDPALLAAASDALSDWARRSDLRIDMRYDRLDIAGAAFDCAVEFQVLDLAARLGDLDIPPGSLVTASALLDLVSERWLTALVDRIAARQAAVLWALSYDGTVRLDPATADDDRVIALVNRHQRTDKGFGPALGPDAWRAGRQLLARAGLEVHAASTAWDCSGRDRDLLTLLIKGWAEAAAEVAAETAAEVAADLAPMDEDGILRWRDARLAVAAEGKLRVRVGHQDLAGRR